MKGNTYWSYQMENEREVGASINGNAVEFAIKMIEVWMCAIS